MANSRIKVDYSTSIMELYMATLADYFLSLGFLTDDKTAIRDRLEMTKTFYTVKDDMCLVAPLVAFGLDAFHPVVYLVTHEIANFFAPGWGKELCQSANQTWWFHRRSGDDTTKLFEQVVGQNPRWEVKYIASVCLRTVKLVNSELRSYLRQEKAASSYQQRLRQDNSEIEAPEDCGKPKRYSEWVSTARTISDTMWKRFQNSGEDVEGDMDDESWTLVG